MVDVLTPPDVMAVHARHAARPKIPEAAISAHPEARKKVTRDVLPAKRTAEKVETILNGLEVYETALNRAMNSKNINENIDSDKDDKILGYERKFDLLEADKRQQNDVLTVKEGENESKPISIKDVATRIIWAESYKEYQPQDRKLEIEQIQNEKALKIFNWFKKDQPGAINVLMELSDIDPINNSNPELQKTLEILIGKNVANWLYYQELNQNSRADYQQMQKDLMARFLIKRVLFADAVTQRYMGKVIGGKENPLEASAIGVNAPQIQEWLQKDYITDELTTLLIKASTERDVALLDRETAIFAMDNWIKEMIHDTKKKGRKVYDTPYYENLLKDLKERGKKINGVAGVILYGPPGTGKTEGLIEKNKREGRKTRVVSIHEYTSFSDLIAEKKVKLNTSGGVVTAETLKTVIEVAEKAKAPEFRQNMQTVLDLLKSEGKIDQKKTLEQFMMPFVSMNIVLGDKQVGLKDIFQKETTNEEDWEVIRKSYIDRQNARIHRTALPSHLQETPDSLVLGEFISAMHNGEMVVADELEKVKNSNALAGVLDFLSKTPGIDSFEYDGVKIPIPSWFRIDATSNGTIFDSPISDRFDAKFLDVPPAIDQMMIASVRLSDDRGNILLPESQQHQLAGFFVYMVPEINQIFIKNDIQPLSNRSIKELTSYLVDGVNMNPTDVSVEEAVEKLLLKNKLWSANEQVQVQLRGVMSRYRSLFREEPEDAMREIKRRPLRPRLTPAERILSDKASVKERMGNIATSPLLESIVELQTIESIIGKPRYTQLTDDQRQQVAEFIRKQDEATIAVSDVLKLPGGKAIEEKSGDTPIMELSAITTGDHDLVLGSSRIEKPGRLITASQEGKTIIMGSQAADGSEELRVVRNVFTGVPPQEFVLPDTFPNTAKVSVDLGGTVYVVDPSKNEVVEYGYAEVKKDANTVERKMQEVDRKKEVTNFSFSPNNSMYLLELADGTTELGVYRGENGTTEKSKLKGTGWQFAGKRLIVQQQNGIVSPQALLAA